MRYWASAFVTAAVMVGVSACGGQVVVVPPETDSPYDPPPTTPANPPGPPGEDPAPPAPVLPTSGSLPANTCVAFLYGSQLTLVGIDLATGSVTQGVKVQAEHSGPPPSSLAVVGDEVLYCDNSSTGRIVRVSRSDGSTTFINRHCSAIAADASGIYLMQDVGGEIDKFADVAALASNAKPVSVGKLHASRLGTSSQGILAAWHSAGEVLRFDGALALDGYDDWIDGLSGAPGNRVIVSSPRADGSKPGLVAFDATTGKNLGVVAKVPSTSPLPFGGLACGE